VSQAQTPPSRTIGTTFGWRRHARILVIILGVAGLAIVVAIFLNSQAPAKKEALAPATSIAGTYMPAPAPEIVRAASREVAPQTRPTPTQAVAEPPKPPPQPSIQVTYFHRPNGQMPEYMKPKPAATSPTDPASGIDYKADTFDGTTAFVMKHPELVLPQWTSIPCVLETGIITGVGGVNPFRCRLPQDVASPSGVVLMEKGTIIGGTYSNLVAEGQTRIVAVSANARTPNNVIVPLGGPMADQIGQAGVEGTVNEHWWRRLGGALILSLLDAGTSLGQSALSANNGNGNSFVNVGNSLGTGSPFAQTAQALLEKEMSIPATIQLKQGEIVMLWTTRWVDFSHVYALQRTAP
jgi:type IV secretion system protein VirB10